MGLGVIKLDTCLLNFEPAGSLVFYYFVIFDFFLSKFFTSTEGFIILEGPDGSLLSAKLRDVKKVLRVLFSVKSKLLRNFLSFS